MIKTKVTTIIYTVTIGKNELYMLIHKLYFKKVTRNFNNKNLW